MSYAKFLEKVKHLQDEALNNTTILGEIAGLEKYISETYTSRVFYELIQNADDCKSSKFHAFEKNKDIYFFNNGSPFTVADLESICRSAFSTKQRGLSIGYRGIGFKSVSAVCSKVSLISGELEVHFSRESTRSLINTTNEVPLLRVPHWGSVSETSKNIAQTYAAENGLTTSFILHDVNEDQLALDLRGVSDNALIFLKSLREVSISLEGNYKTIVRTTTASKTLENQAVSSLDIELKTTSSFNQSEEPTVREMRTWRFKELDIAANLEDNMVHRLPKNKAYAQAFLPMLTTTGLGAIVNGNFSTDPSRTRITPDENTKEALAQLTELTEYLLTIFAKQSISSEELELLRVLIPYRQADIFDISPTYIADQLKANSVGIGEKLLNGFIFLPQWMNPDDFLRLCEGTNLKPLYFSQLNAADVYAFFSRLGVKDIAMPVFIDWLTRESMSLTNTASFLKYVIRDEQLYMQVIASDQSLTKSAAVMICEDGKVCNSKQFLESNKQFDKLLIRQLFDLNSNVLQTANLLTHFGLPLYMVPPDLLDRIAKQASTSNSTKKYSRLILELETAFGAISSPQEESDASSIALLNTSIKSSIDTDSYSALARPAWRLAEQLAVKFFSSKGYNVVDVSKRNVGYDLEATSPNGKTHYIEVKLLSCVGEGFRLTDNELYMSKEKQQDFWLFLVVQPDKSLPPSHYCLVEGFYEKLSAYIDRRCVKYELYCSDYDLVFTTLQP